MNNRSSTGSQAGRRNASVPGQVNPVVYILSLLVLGLGATMVIPLLVEWAARDAHPTMFAVPMLAAMGTVSSCLPRHAAMPIWSWTIARPSS